jgi:hypothetical protein
MWDLKPISRKSLILKLKKLCFKWPFIWWKHQYMKNNSNFKITIPNIHSWKDLWKPIVAKICQELWIDKNLFMDL